MGAHQPSTNVTFTAHAKKRCQEMRYRYSQVKAVVRDAEVVRPAGKAKMAISTTHPEIGVVFDDSSGHCVIITVVWRTYQPYQRRGFFYEPLTT